MRKIDYELYNLIMARKPKKVSRLYTVAITESETQLWYHSTNIVTHNIVSNELNINNGGYQTQTTKDRINGQLSLFNVPAYIYQKDFKWFLSHTINDVTQIRPYYKDATFNLLTGDIVKIQGL